MTTQRAEAHHDAVEVVVPAAVRDRLAVGRDQLERRDRGSEVAVADAGSVGRRRDGAADGDVRQRREVVDREALLAEELGELAVGEAGGERGRAGVAVDHEVGRQLGERDQHVGVGDVVERVAGSQHADRRRVADDGPQLLDARRGMDLAGPVRVVAGPVGARGALLDGVGHASSSRPPSDAVVSSLLALPGEGRAPGRPDGRPGPVPRQRLRMVSSSVRADGHSWCSGSTSRPHAREPSPCCAASM